MGKTKKVMAGGKGVSQETKGLPTSFEWDEQKGSTRKKRRVSKLAWLLIAVLVAFVAIVIQFGGSEEAPTESTTGTEAEEAVESGDERELSETATKSKKPLEPPPIDTWAKPSECAAWAGDGQCKANAEFMMQNCKFRSLHLRAPTPYQISQTTNRPTNRPNGTAPPHCELLLLVPCSCAKIEFAKQRYYSRCPIPEDYTATLAPGELHGVFARVMKVLSHSVPAKGDVT